MAILSIGFLTFYAVLFALYYIVPKRYQWVVLLVGSYTFYFFSGIKNFIFIALTTLTTFFAAKQMQGIEDSKDSYFDDTLSKRDNKKRLQARKKKFMLFAVILNFAVLFLLKYMGLLKSISSLLGIPEIPINLGFLIPLGISFYTFQSIGYVIDVYNNKTNAETNVFKYALFISYFPQIIQGPISRFEDLHHQFFDPKSFDYDAVKHGLQLFIWGAFKKLVIADRAAVVVATIFGDSSYKGMYLIIGIVFYSIQIYGDFSGGIDMIRGVSQTFQIHLIDNFEQPYFATSISDFWRRWHISLGNWMRNYIFYPLALSRRLAKFAKKLKPVIGNFLSKQFSVAVATTVVFLVVGMWHGSGFKFLAFGLYQALFTVSEPILEPVHTKVKSLLNINDQTIGFRIFQILRTFTLINLGRFFQRASGFRRAVSMIISVFTEFQETFYDAMSSIYKLGLDISEMAVLFFALLILFFVGLAHEKKIRVRVWLDQQNLAFRWVMIYGLIFVVLIFGFYGPNVNPQEFIYRGF